MEASEMLGDNEHEWKPIPEESLWSKINFGAGKLLSEELHFWELIKINPEKWEEEKFGKQGDGFWVVAVAGHTVIWYNDIEEGFNISRYRKFGEIGEYFSNQDDLDNSVRRLFALVRFGGNVTGQAGPPEKLGRI
jgi:hypothetical protein